MQRAILKEFDQFYQFQILNKNIKAVFTNRKLNLGFANQLDSQIKKNRQAILSKLGLSLDQFVCAQQIHGDNVYIVGQEDKGKGALSYKDAIANTDAFITKEKGMALAVFIADCLPIFIIDNVNDVIALVHAGWKSTKISIVKKTIFIMQQAIGSQPKDIIILFGPAIRRCCYEVGEEFKDYFKRGIYKKGNKLVMDLPEINRQQLIEIGVVDKNIFDSQLCTSCRNDIFFSYRKEGKTCGRQMALIIMEND